MPERVPSANYTTPQRRMHYHKTQSSLNRKFDAIKLKNMGMT